jgi:phosphate transport system substrate-binding protein
MRIKRSVGRRLALLGGALAAIGLVASAALAASSVTNPTYNLKTLKGSIVADGSSTVGPYTQAAAELFSKAGASKVRVTVGITGTGGGFEKFCRGETDISDASRPMKLSEAQLCKNNNIGSWRAFLVANDALSVVVNRANTWATCLTVPELKSIWNAGSKISNWKDVRGGFPDEPLKLFGAGTDSGTFDYFTEVINGKSRASRSDYNASEDDNVLVQGVTGETGALGYFGFSYYEENRNNLKALQVQNPDTGRCVAPSVATAQDGTYKPLARPLFIYVRGSSFARPEVQAFVDYILDNETAIAKRAKYVPLTPAQLRKAKITLDLALKAVKRQ